MAKKSGPSTAYHEAGHAVVGLVRGLDVTFLTIIETETSPGRRAAGYCIIEVDRLVMEVASGFGDGMELEDLEAGYAWIESRMLMCLAGATTEQRVTGEWNMSGATADMTQIGDIVQEAYCGPSEFAPVEPDARLCAEMDFDHWDEELDKSVVLTDYTGVIERARERWGPECEDIITTNWAWIEAVAQAALDGDGNLTGEELLALRC
jgi:uncharacterized protein YndB with AHSA1/START domain